MVVVLLCGIKGWYLTVGEHRFGKVALSHIACKWFGNSKRVELGVEIPVREVVETDRPGGITRVVLHELGDIDVAGLLESLSGCLVLLFVRHLRQLLVIVGQTTKREKLVDELLAGIVVRHHYATLVKLGLQFVNDFNAVTGPACLKLLERDPWSKRIEEHFGLEVFLDELLHHDEHLVEAFHAQTLIVYLFDCGEHGTKDGTDVIEKEHVPDQIHGRHGHLVHEKLHEPRH